MRRTDIIIDRLKDINWVRSLSDKKYYYCYSNGSGFRIDSKGLEFSSNCSPTLWERSSNDDLNIWACEKHKTLELINEEKKILKILDSMIS